VADAVYVERVSATKFPANREINREKCKIVRGEARGSSPNAASMGFLGSIPCENYQGMFFAEQGNSYRVTGKP
jgi:hypothetical protein